MRAIYLLPTVLGLFLATVLGAGCGDDDDDSGLNDAGVPDLDTDSDSDSDGECDAPPGVTGWGMPCNPDAPANGCTANQVCVYYEDPPEDAHQSFGICTVECCTPNDPDPDYCTDVADGDEACIMLGTGEQWCGINCDNDADCPPELICIAVSGGVCYPPAADVPDAGPDAGSDAG